MGYIHDVEEKLRELLEYGAGEGDVKADQEAVVHFVKERLLESYRNGMKASENGNAGKRNTEQKPGKWKR